jgi:hypothetical protein
MMWRFRAGCALVALAASASGASLAQDVAVTRPAQSGVASVIGYERAWDRDCRALGAQVTITAQPQHGAVSVATAQSVIPPTTPRGGSTGQCAGQTVAGNQITYRSQPGFRGTDHVSWSVVYGNGRGGRTDVTIVVQ